VKTFKEAWAAKEREGYQYGGDALENVEFGWEIACAEMKVNEAEVWNEAIDAVLKAIKEPTQEQLAYRYSSDVKTVGIERELSERILTLKKKI
jgi:hypothetical protein